MAKKNEIDRSLYDVVNINTLEIPKFIKIFRRKGNKVCAFFGGPGIGKTESIREAGMIIAKEGNWAFKETPTPEDWKDTNNFGYMIVLASSLSEEEGKGLPFKYQLPDGTWITKYLPTENFPEHGRGFIVFDEFCNGREPVMQMMQQMLLAHTAGNLKISPDITFIIASNRPLDNTGCNEPPDATKNRVGWFEVARPPCDKWLEKMEEIGKPINPAIAGFLLSIGSEYYDNHGEASTQYAYGSPRSNHIASDLIEGETDLKLISQLYGSCVGRAAGESLKDFIELTEKIDMSALLKTPALITQYEADRGKLYSICLNMINRAFETPTTMLEPVLGVCIAMTKTEYGAFTLKGLINKWGDGKAIEKITKCPNGKPAMMKYYKILKVSAGQ